MYWDKCVTNFQRHFNRAIVWSTFIMSYLIPSGDYNENDR